MDTETVELLSQNVAAWCSRNASLLESMERRSDGESGMKLYGELERLGVLDILHDTTMHDSVGMVAAIAHAFALHSPSLALMAVQQNMAAYLLAEAGEPAPTGWVSLPLYDSPSEWPHQLRVSSMSSGLKLEGVWCSLPALAMAECSLLPVDGGSPETFSLVRITVNTNASVVFRSGVVSLGLRGCGVGDLGFDGVRIKGDAILTRGLSIRNAMVALWSQAEVCMLAIRAAILERSYIVARDYAAVRWQGGRMIIEHSLIRKMLSDLHLAKSSLDEAWRAMAAALEPGKPLTDGQMAVALKSAAELPDLTADGIQLLGGNGYMEDYGQERLFRDAKQCEMLLGHPQAKRFSIWENA